MSDVRFTQSTKIALYVVKTNPDYNSQHHGLRANTSKHVVTFRPGAGDEIVYALPGVIDTEYEWRPIGETTDRWVPISSEAQITTTSEVVPRHRTTSQGNPYWVNFVEVLFGSHPGRACGLGEDGLEDAFGQPILKDLFFEHVANSLGIPGGRIWRYAPIEVTEEEDVKVSRSLFLTVEYDEVDNESGWREYKGHKFNWS